MRIAFWIRTAVLLLAGILGCDAADPITCTNVLSVKKIWHSGQHNAFTDLIQYKGQWFCTFRESQAHVGGNGKIRVLVSKDGENWGPAGLLAEDGIDLRDPKLSITPDSKLMLSLGGSVYEGKMFKERQSRVSFSDDGTNWTSPERILKKGDWLWRVTWHKGKAYGISYATASNQSSTNKSGMSASLVSTRDGVHYDPVCALDVNGSPNEATIRFLNNDDAVILIRRETGDLQAWIGTSSLPYTKWQWHPAGMRVGGPNFIVADASMLVSGRQHGNISKDVKTFVGTMTTEHITPLLSLPSGGDCSYPGMVLKDGQLWISYYSSHEGATDIYLAKIGCSGRR